MRISVLASIGPVVLLPWSAMTSESTRMVAVVRKSAVGGVASAIGCIRCKGMVPVRERNCVPLISIRGQFNTRDYSSRVAECMHSD